MTKYNAPAGRPGQRKDSDLSYGAKVIVRYRGKWEFAESARYSKSKRKFWVTLSSGLRVWLDEHEVMFQWSIFD